MSWILKNAEDFLTRVDNAAGQALHKDGTELPTHSLQTTESSSSEGFSPGQVSEQNYGVSSVYTSQHFAHSSTVSTTQSQGFAAATYDAGSQGVSSAVSAQKIEKTVVQGTLQKSNSKSSLKRDKDEELFEFLNASDNGSDTNGAAAKKPATSLPSTSLPSGKASVGSSTRHSRQSSASSVSTNGKGTDSGFSFIAMPDSDDAGMKMDRTSDSSPLHSEASKESPPITSTVSAPLPSEQTQESSIELENKLLKHEIQSLNQEMSSVIHRAKNAQGELVKVKRQLETSQSQLSRGDALMREMQSREADLQEALSAKDSQIGVLRIRFEELEKEMVEKTQTVQELSATKDRILEDHSSASGMQSQALESVQEKLRETEELLRREKDSARHYQQEIQNRQTKVEAEQQSLTAALTAAQKKINEEKGRAAELQGQLKTIKNQADNHRQELQDYKDKATRILQSKERLISSLKEGGGGGAAASGTTEGSAVNSVELESARQEISLMKEELQHNRMTIENLRAECQDFEVQMQQESESLNENISVLEDQLQNEKRAREDAEQELTRSKQELRYAHEELHKQKSAFQTRLQDRETEIEKLRNQLMTKSFSNSGQTELENRLHSLTESLIQKQTSLEAVSTEKNALMLQLERLQKQYAELERTTTSTPRVTSIHIHEDDEVRNRLPGFLRESPNDSEVFRKVKRAYGTVDRFSVRIGVFLRRYPIARIFVIAYMFLLHLWTMTVLLTYKPEIHGEDYSPHLPQGPR